MGRGYIRTYGVIEGYMGFRFPRMAGPSWKPPTVRRIVGIQGVPQVVAFHAC